MSLVLFATYVMVSPDNVLGPDKVFVTFAIINILQFPISQLPRAVNQLGQAVVTIDRITRFLMLEEKDQNAVVYDADMGTSTSAVRVQYEYKCSTNTGHVQYEYLHGTV